MCVCVCACDTCTRVTECSVDDKCETMEGSASVFCDWMYSNWRRIPWLD